MWRLAANRQAHCLKSGGEGTNLYTAGQPGLAIWIFLYFLRFYRECEFPIPAPVSASEAYGKRMATERAGSQINDLRNQAIWILLACLPLGPVVISKVTR